MDYEQFKDEYNSFQEWWDKQPKYEDKVKFKNDVITFGKTKDNLVSITNYDWLDDSRFEYNERVNSPSHYTSGRLEAIDIIEDAVKDAPTPGKGVLQSQVLKYMLRVWLKDNPLEDLKKAEWYLQRLINNLEEENR